MEGVNSSIKAFELFLTSLIGNIPLFLKGILFLLIQIFFLHEFELVVDVIEFLGICEIVNVIRASESTLAVLSDTDGPAVSAIVGQGLGLFLVEIMILPAFEVHLELIGQSAESPENLDEILSVRQEQVEEG
jgi:hypothetical protein